MRFLATIAIVALATFPLHDAAHAGENKGGKGTETNTDDGNGDINVGAYTGAIYTDGSRGGGGPRCRWNQLTVGDFEQISNQTPPPVEPDLIPDDELTEEELAARERAREIAAERELERTSRPATSRRAGTTLYIYGVTCPNGLTGNGIRFIPIGITATDLIAGITDYAHGRIETPIPNVSPKFEYTGYVNLGMWLAIEPTTINPVSAEAGPNAWITVSPQHATISFDFGNGDTITCDGTGVPIIDTDTFDEGPCGYTYRLSSPDDDPYQVTITTTWNLPTPHQTGPAHSTHSAAASPLTTTSTNSKPSASATKPGGCDTVASAWRSVIVWTLPRTISVQSVLTPGTNQTEIVVAAPAELPDAVDSTIRR